MDGGTTSSPTRVPSSVVGVVVVTDALLVSDVGTLVLGIPVLSTTIPTSDIDVGTLVLGIPVLRTSIPTSAMKVVAKSSGRCPMWGYSFWEHSFWDYPS